MSHDTAMVLPSSLASWNTREPLAAMAGDSRDQVCTSRALIWP